jgi:mevalonate kinase
MVVTSAPGKMMFFGEHAAVYGVPCIALAVNQRLYCSIKERPDDKIVLKFPDLGIVEYVYDGKLTEKKVSFVSTAIKNTLPFVKQKRGFEIETKSEMKKGVGTSSACIVATIAAMNEFFKLNLTKEQMFEIGYKTVIEVQGKGSGYDVATSLYGGVIRYVKGQPPIEIDYPKDMCLIMGHTNIKADTVELIDKVAKKKTRYTHFFDEVLELTKMCVEESEQSLKKGDMEGVADMMNFIHGILNGMGVSHPKLEELIFASRDAGAIGAKLSGAGGGDCMIALATDKTKDKIMEAIRIHGGIPHEIRIAEGAKVERTPN